MGYHPIRRPWRIRLLCAALCAAALWVAASAPVPAARADAGTGTGLSDDAGARASRLMARSIVAIREARLSRGIPIDPSLDPHRTGIIGEEFTPLTTSLGDVDAKRTSANPAFAGAVASYFTAAGLRRGDVVAVGASGSFPALLLATLSAARALDLEPLVIYSIGSSMYGANLEGFTFVDMLARLREDGLLPYRLLAVSPGGYRDTGRGVLFDEGGHALDDEARRSGLPVIGAASLAENIQARLRLYESAAAGRPVRCFVNVGGASANIGDTPAVLEVPNGLVVPPMRAPASPTRGLLFEFAARDIPVVHLLHVRGLAAAHHLPYDPVLPPGGWRSPLPE